MRYPIVDILRGIALLGILFVNFPLYVAPPGAFFSWMEGTWWTARPDELALLFTFIAAKGKFYTLFSFLFGVGFGLQPALRADAEEAPAALRRYRRRLLVLFGIGLLHYFLVWEGDVLAVYALLGFVLILFREWRQERVLRFAVAMLLSPLVGSLVVSTVRPPAEAPTETAERRQKASVELHEEIRVMDAGSYGEQVALRVKKAGPHWQVNILWSLELFANFLLGLWVARAGLLQHPREHLGLLRRVFWIGFPAGLALSAICNSVLWLRAGSEMSLPARYCQILEEFGARPLLAFGLAAGIVLLLAQSRKRWWTGWFQAAGRMSLTNYLTASLFWTTAANSYGLRLFGIINPLKGLACIAVFFTMQALFSMLWLRYFRFGPLEWVWRALTYGTRPALLRTEALLRES